MNAKPSALIIMTPPDDGPMAHDFGGDSYQSAKRAIMQPAHSPCGHGDAGSGGTAPPDPTEMGRALASAGLSVADLADWLTEVASVALPAGADLELDVEADAEAPGDDPPDDYGR
jgi:hypothetical protein